METHCGATRVEFVRQPGELIRSEVPSRILWVIETAQTIPDC
ncbi:hypothetical protein SynWH8103_00539 [Synechococcus sp. WH 8103]|nr:hypothetical protein SynWH8103_00539 [Synechococcus sp. WH 8103]